MGPYLLHPDKLQAVHNVVLKQRARKPAKAKQKAPAAAAPLSGNIVLRLLQQEYLNRQKKTGRSY